jgi:hypothetical protein
MPTPAPRFRDDRDAAKQVRRAGVDARPAVGAIPSPPLAEPVRRARPDELLVIAVGLGYRILRKSDDDRSGRDRPRSRSGSTTAVGTRRAGRPGTVRGAIDQRAGRQQRASAPRPTRGKVPSAAGAARRRESHPRPTHYEVFRYVWSTCGGSRALLELEPLPWRAAGCGCSLSRPHSPAWTGGPAPVTYPWAQPSTPRGSCPRRPPPARRSGP